MIPRLLYSLLLAAILLANVWFGVARMAGFRHRYVGEKALARAEIDVAYERLVASLEWQPSDSPSHILIGRVIHFAQSNSVPIAALGGLQPEQVLGVGVGAITRGIALNPSDAWAWFNLAEAYRGYQLRRSRLDKLRAMVAAAREGSDPAATRVEMEKGGFRSEDPVIIAATLKALELEPEFSFYHDFLAKVYWDRGMVEEAAREIRDGFALTPQPQAHPWMADLEFARGLQEPILEGIERARSSPFVDPLAVLLARAEVLDAVGRNEEAIEAYETLRREGGPGVEAECDLRLARLHQEEDRYGQSVLYLERVLKADPDSKSATSALYYLGLAYSKLEEPRKAVEYYRRHLTRKPGTKRVFLSFAGQLEIIGETAEAEKIYASLIERYPEDPIAYRRIINLLERRRRIGEALQYAERFAQAAPDSEEAAALLRQLRGGGEDLP